MCSAHVPQAHITREALITSEGHITFRVSGTHRLAPKKYPKPFLTLMKHLLRKYEAEALRLL